MPSSGFGVVQTPAIVEHQGICDASGVVDLGQGRFAVADDELNLLLVFHADGNGKPIYQTEISEFLGVVKQKKEKPAKKPKKSPAKNKPAKQKKLKVQEVDIEGAARLGDTVFWIASHGRKASGKEATERMQFFATSIVERDNRVELVPKGIPYDNLFVDLLEDPNYANFGLQAAAEKAPKEPGGLSIEAITDTPAGTILIGFRSPLIEGKALIAQLTNPEEVLHGEKAFFGKPILLDLAGNGIRSISSHEGDFLIAANDPEGDSHNPQLFRWDGVSPRATPVKSLHFGDFNPEAVAIMPDYRGGKVLILSDDGSRLVGPDQCKCKELKDHSQRRFRSTMINYSDLPDLANN